jgi:putative chitinase
MSDMKINGEEIKFDGKYIITPEQLYKIIPRASKSNIQKFIVPLNVTMKKFNITSPLQISAFISQIAIESGYLKYTKELGATSYFNKYEPTTKIGKGLGNTQTGDGAKYRGRGLIQTTGRSNYMDLSKSLGTDFINTPELLETPMWASLSAGYWWFKNQKKKTSKMNANLAGCINNKDISGITRAVNGGQNALTERAQAYKSALNILGVA